MVRNRGSRSLWRNASGFSSLEIVVVIAVIALLASISFGVLQGMNRRKQAALADADLARIQTALAEYRAQYGTYPEANHGDRTVRQNRLFRALAGQILPDGGEREEPGPTFLNWSRLHTSPERVSEISDPWGSPFEYRFASDWTHGQYFLLSAGADQKIKPPDADGRYSPGSKWNLDNRQGNL